jgi:DNA (cytosine-5)-methyltransferase 1
VHHSWNVNHNGLQRGDESMNIISLFSGAGGLDLGFKATGFTTVWANEYDKTIIPSFKLNFPNVRLETRSITDIPSQDIPTDSILGVIGGPPCQSWSSAGAKKGVDDPRGKLFFEYIRVIKVVKPLFFVAENVQGLLAERNREVFENILAIFKELNYKVSWKLVNASDYEVPQDRKRVIIVGYLNDLGKTFTFPPQQQKITLFDAISNMNSVCNTLTKDPGFSPHVIASEVLTSNLSPF